MRFTVFHPEKCFHKLLFLRRDIHIREERMRGGEEERDRERGEEERDRERRGGYL